MRKYTLNSSRGPSEVCSGEGKSGVNAEKEEILLIGPAVLLELGTTDGGSGAKGESSHALANQGYDPDEPRIPAGQAGGGQWTSGDAGEEGSILLVGPSFPITTGVEPPPIDLSKTIWPLYAWDGSASRRLKSGMIKVYRIPKNAVRYVSPSGQEFYAPAGIDFKAMHDLAKCKPPLPEGKAIRHYGAFDFQRNAGQGPQKDTNNDHFYPAYTDASNYAVGVYTHGEGDSREFAVAKARAFALKNSGNAGDPRQESMWVKGWNDAEAGRFAKPAPPQMRAEVVLRAPSE